MRRFCALGLLVLLGGLAWLAFRAYRPPPPPPPSDPPGCGDVAEGVGLNFPPDAAPGGESSLPEIMASGAPLFDFAGDGRLALFLAPNGAPKSKSVNRLFRQRPDG